MPSQHARLSPSAAHRWMKCPAAPAREALLPYESSVYADEGTLAHAVAARELKSLLGRDTADEDKEILQLSPRFDLNEICETVIEYVDAVWQTYQATKKQHPDTVLLVEQRLDLTGPIGSGFGTADALIAHSGELDVFDLKYGMGVKVAAVGNPQMRIYALGAADHLSDYDFRTVRTHIVQPRLHHHDVEDLSWDDLHSWHVAVLTPAVTAASSEGAPANAGDWCRFCRDKMCITRARAAMSLPALDTDAKTISNDALGRDILPQLDTIKAWVTAMETAALDMAKRGEKVPGYKLVEGRARRVMTDPEEVVRRLVNNGADMEAIYPRTPKTLTAIEKAVGKKEFAAVCSDLITKQTGAPKLVAISEPGREVDGAAVFEVIKD